MKYVVIREEMWPFFMLEPAEAGDSPEDFVPPELVVRYESMMAEFGTVQDILSKRFEQRRDKGYPPLTKPLPPHPPPPKPPRNRD